MESVRGWLVPVGAAVLIVSLVAVALVREPAQLDPNTPEGTVQVYLQALSDGDYEGAFAVLDPEFMRDATPARWPPTVRKGSPPESKTVRDKPTPTKPSSP